MRPEGIDAEKACEGGFDQLGLLAIQLLQDGEHAAGRVPRAGVLLDTSHDHAPVLHRTEGKLKRVHGFQVLPAKSGEERVEDLSGVAVFLQGDAEAVAGAEEVRIEMTPGAKQSEVGGSMAGPHTFQQCGFPVRPLQVGVQGFQDAGRRPFQLRPIQPGGPAAELCKLHAFTDAEGSQEGAEDCMATRQ